jgi:hypothetical protein
VRYPFASRIGLVTVLAAASCARHDEPRQPLHVTPQASAQDFLTSDGKVDYAQLYKTFGAPNQNLDMNPKAIDVAKTTSASQVSIRSDRLVFTGSENAWVQRLSAGYTLYCNSTCGAHGFLRNVQSVQRQGDQWIVMTTLGSIPDIMRHGWLHAKVHMIDRATHVTPHLEWQKPVSFPTLSQTGSVAMPSPVTGSLQGTISFTSGVTIDIVTSGLSISLFSVIATGTPAVDVLLDATASASYSHDWPLFSQSFPLGDFQIGPVPVVPNLILTGSAHAEASGSVNLHGTAHAGVQMTAGFNYTSANGASGQAGWNPTFNESLTLSGKADAKASVEIDANLAFQVFDVAGPQVTVTTQLGAEGSASFSLGQSTGGNTCVTDIQGDIYFTIGGKCGVNLTVPHIGSIKKDVDLDSQTFYLQKYDFPVDNFCGGPDAGSTQPPDAGSTTPPDAGSTGCSGTQQDCNDGQGCHDLSADPANCGQCGNSCATLTGSAASTCSGGSCQCICPDGMTACPGTDSSGCTSGTTCASGTADCDQSGNCATNTTNDAQNCGACGTQCGSQICANSQCMCSDMTTVCSDPTCSSCPAQTVQCQPGMFDCDGSGNCATDGNNDPSNCGGCSNMGSQFDCASVTGSSASTCSNGACQCVCPDGSTTCPGSDASSCTTQCATGTADCTGSGSCSTDTTSDPSNCGGCGTVCPSQICVNSQCACDASGTPPCPDGTCASPDTNSDPTHCGAACGNCYNQTGSDTSTCSAGVCQCLCADGTACPGSDASSCNSGTVCGSGQQDCLGNGTCIDLTSDANNCSGCGVVCPSGFCVSSTCACDSSGTPTCNNACPDYTSDNNNCGSCGNDCTQANGQQGYGPQAICSGSNCTCTCTCPADGSACPNCDQTQCP